MASCDGGWPRARVFDRVLVSLLQKTVLEQVLDIVCAEAQGLIGATGSAVLLLTDQAWLEVKHRLGKPLAAVEPVPDGWLVGGPGRARGCAGAPE